VLVATILVSQTGLYADADMYDSAYVTMTGVLWTPEMITPVVGGGYVTVTNEVIGYPRFANQGYEYEITLFSAARNAGVPIDTGSTPWPRRISRVIRAPTHVWSPPTWGLTN
jgi:hypothetical protein